MIKKQFFKPIIGLLTCSVLLSALYGCGGENKSQNSDSVVSVQNNGNSIIQTDATNENAYTLSNVKYFSDGYAWVWIQNSRSGDMKCACIDTNGKIQFILEEVINEKIDNQKLVRDYKDGFAVVQDNNNITYILDTKGNVVSSSKSGIYDHIVCYDDGMFLIEKCNNDLHEVSYTFSIIDDKENFFVSNCLKFEKEITEYSNFNYLGDNVFSYTRHSSGYGSAYDLINANTGNVFSISVDNFYGFNDNKGIVVKDSKNQIIDVNGNYSEIPLKDFYAISSTHDNRFAYKKRNEDSLFVYNLSTGQSNELYHCGKGITAKCRACNDEVFLLEIEDTTKSYDTDKGKYWFTLVDYQGNELFTPKEGRPVGFSSNRIVAYYQNQPDSNKVFDEKGNELLESKKGELTFAQGSLFYDGLLCVNTDGISALYSDSYSACNNYIDTNGNLLFPNGTITL